MVTAFVIIGLGALCLSAGLRASLAPGKRVLLGVAPMAVTALGFILAGVFTTDPTGADDTTTAGSLHLLGAVLVRAPLQEIAFPRRGVTWCFVSQPNPSEIPSRRAAS